MDTLPDLQWENANKGVCRHGLIELPSLLPQMQARERDQRKKFSDRNRLSARRKDAVLTYLSGGTALFF